MTGNGAAYEFTDPEFPWIDPSRRTDSVMAVLQVAFYVTGLNWFASLLCVHQSPTVYSPVDLSQVRNAGIPLGFAPLLLKERNRHGDNQTTHHQPGYDACGSAQGHTGFGKEFAAQSKSEQLMK